MMGAMFRLEGDVFYERAPLGEIAFDRQKWVYLVSLARTLRENQNGLDATKSLNFLLVSQSSVAQGRALDEFGRNFHDKWEEDYKEVVSVDDYLRKGRLVSVDVIMLDRTINRLDDRQVDQLFERSLWELSSKGLLLVSMLESMGGLMKQIDRLRRLWEGEKFYPRTRADLSKIMNNRFMPVRVVNYDDTLSSQGSILLYVLAKNESPYRRFTGRDYALYGDSDDIGRKVQRLGFVQRKQ